MPTISATSHLRGVGDVTVSDFGMGRRYARHVVGDAEALELALLVELVDRLEGHLVWCAAIWPVEVPHVERAAPATH